MSITAEPSEDGQSVTIAITGRFDFSVHREFRAAQEQYASSHTAVIVDMDETEYLDSSALGMLLMLRERAGGDRAKVKIANCRNDVRKILTIANFHKLFEIG